MKTNTHTNTLKLVDELKSKDEDFEWYPTTDEIIKVVARDLIDNSGIYHLSVLDIGAGNGSALKKIEKYRKYYIKQIRQEATSDFTVDKFAIEKSQTLISNMDSDIFILGTDFLQQTLIDKTVDVVFCNPPYSEYDLWMKKILKESNAKLNYFVVPKRWQDNKELQDVIEQRGLYKTSLGIFTFEKAERQARAVVEILCIQRIREDKKSAFEIWFNETFKINAETKSVHSYEYTDKKEKEIKQQLVKGQNIIEQLEELYKNDMQKLLMNYKSLESLDSELFKELSIDINSLKKGLEEKIKGLKNLYWNELFDNFSAITDRLTSKSRKEMLDVLQGQTCIDYTSENAYAVVLWAIKNANRYIDKQMVDMYKELTDIENIEGYKSNKHYIDDNFRSYNKNTDSYGWEKHRRKEDLLKSNCAYKLDYRLINQIYSTFGSYSDSDKLSERARRFIEDIITIAKTLGFDFWDSEKQCLYETWQSGKAYKFITKHNEEFMEIRVYQKGTIHYKFNQKFMKKFNLEVGRLLGWIKDYKHASQELNIPINECMQMFNSTIKLCRSNVLLLAC